MGWIDHLEDLGTNAVLLGPVFESSTHGYDVADYFKVDRRLGDDAALAAACHELHRRGIRIVLDAVFHHTGRDFWAFRDVLEKGQSSPYRDWYHLDFTRRSPCGDPFHYQGWAGHYDLAKLNVGNPAVRDHLLAAVTWWVDRFAIDGLRLDAADALDLDFQHRLAAHCRDLKSDFWLMGEVVHGDYRKWAHPGGLASTTNYEAYKGLWSSLNDRNYFEIAYSLNRQFGPAGIYGGLPLYTFADNHDVARAASILREPAHLYPLYALLLTMPGVPSIYYGSECGIEGRKGQGTDAPLRPALEPVSMLQHAPCAELYATIKTLIGLRCRHSALRHGDYTQLHVAHEQFAFMRRDAAEAIVVALNASDRCVDLQLPDIDRALLVDDLNGGETFGISNGKCALRLHPRSARVLVLR
ncbi:MAG TPA: alpha-amylase family glycosyl hydrolase [Candidatus Binataceae bacterium]|nr:alpha-amylase family glycosyl hydrolase [Candidatus Binataceae bacterium]